MFTLVRPTVGLAPFVGEGWSQKTHMADKLVDCITLLTQLLMALLNSTHL